MKILHKTGKNGSNVTVVTGLPRSGTSLMMQILEAGGEEVLTDRFRPSDADNPKGYYEFEDVKKLREGENNWITEAQGKAVKVVAPLLPYLPTYCKYKIIFMHRNLPEILASQRKMLYNRGEDTGGMDDETMGKVFERYLKSVDLWIGNLTNSERLDISYNKLLANPRSQVKRINRFFGGGLSEELMIKVVDPGLYRQRI